MRRTTTPTKPWRASIFLESRSSKIGLKIFIALPVSARYHRAFPRQGVPKMLKSILGVIVGYIVRFIFGLGVVACAYFALGVEGIFEPESYAFSTIWLAIIVAVELISGIIGGLICAAISKSKGACMAFAIIVLAIGLIWGIPAVMKEHPSAVRSSDVTILQAMPLAQPPTWMLLLNPVLGAVGVMLGARMKKLPTA
jgi:hypothetical protein